jgi:hypothetical protein
VFGGTCFHLWEHLQVHVDLSAEGPAVGLGII